MPAPDEAPKLPKLPFLAADAALLLIATLLWYFHPDPFAVAPLLAIVACCVLAVVLGTIPFLYDYLRAQDLALAERQSSLEALGRTVAESSETLAIAASGLNTIAESAQRAARAAAELQQQLEQRASDDRDALEQELASLRAARTAEVVAALERLQKVAADLGRLDQTLARHTTPLQEVTAGLPALARDAAQAAGTELREQLAAVAERTSAVVVRDLTNAATPVAERLATAAQMLDHAGSILGAATDRLERSAREAAAIVTSALGPRPIRDEPPPAAPQEIVPVAPDTPEPFPMREARLGGTPSTPPVTVPAAEATTPPAAETEAPSSPPEAGIAATPPPAAATPASPAPEPAADEATSAPAGEPPAPVEKPRRERAPRKPRDPAATPVADEAPVASPPPSAPPTTPATPAAVAAPAAAPAPAAPAAPLELELGLPPPETPPPIVSDTADGATRLLATAYIGIGNRLHLRGDGPGLSWEKGVPLQFVSIGKWRWEAPMPATAPFRVKLYKNDTHECTALGELTLDPGRQVEVRAEFG